MLPNANGAAEGGSCRVCIRIERRQPGQSKQRSRRETASLHGNEQLNSALVWRPPFHDGQPLSVAVTQIVGGGAARDKWEMALRPRRLASALSLNRDRETLMSYAEELECEAEALERQAAAAQHQ
jgi:hypothetical protein